MIELALAAAAMLVPAHTDEGRRVTIRGTKRHVTRVTGTIGRYSCQDFGDVGPVRFDVRVRARVDRRGRFSFVTGDPAERIGIAGYVRGKREGRGRVRMSGTIATGQRCRSRIVRFR